MNIERFTVILAMVAVAAALAATLLSFIPRS